jgi:apolipoprotein N-acyltransferase
MLIKNGWQGMKGHVLALTGGAILPLAFAPFQFYPLAVVSLVMLFLAWQGVTPKLAALRGFLFGLGLFGVGVSWVYVAIHVFGQASIAVAGLMTFGFVAFLASYLALVGWLVKRYGPTHFSTWELIVFLPLVWMAYELFKGWFLTGFPWLELGVSQIDGPLAGYVPLIGVIGVSWLVALSAGLIVAFLQKRQWFYLIGVMCIWLIGQPLQSINWTKTSGEPLKVSLIQGNVPQEIKWNKEQLFKTLALYEARTAQNWDSDLIIWPENAITVFYHQAKELFFDPLMRQAKQNNTDILVGLPAVDLASKTYYNSMMLLAEQPEFYHKQHLVPFGDYIPFEWLRGLIAFFDLPMSSFTPGSNDQPLIEAAGHKVGISICYEDVFSTEVMQTLPEAELLVNATNNAWYGDSFAPHQHLQISRSRALEMGRPVLRATTNGISAVIDHNGQIMQQTPQFEEAVLTLEVTARQGATPYVQWQRWPLWIMTLFMIGLWAYHRRQNR